MDETLLQFSEGCAVGNRQSSSPRIGRCSVCGSHFAADAHFCPFDGTELEPELDWDPTVDPLLGSLVDDRYHIERVIGEGGMGKVYEVRHHQLGRYFALKALRRELAQDDELGARFIQEARAAAAISHPNVVQITDFGTLPTGQPYFVMELLSGYSLRALIRKGPLTPMQGILIARQAAEALAAAHSAGVIHRDLKPDNIHLSEGPGGRVVVKVLDFGLAKVAGASRLSRAGVVFGTPYYMSPEQAGGEDVDHRSDLYAFGVVLYEVFAGRVPFDGDSFMNILTKHMYMSPVPPSQLMNGQAWSVELERIIMRCLEKRRADRYRDMAELSAKLEDLARSLLSESGMRAIQRPPSELPVEEAESARPSMRALGLRGVAVAGVAALLGGLTTWWWVRSGVERDPGPPATNAVAVSAAQGAPPGPTDRSQTTAGARGEARSASGPDEQALQTSPVHIASGAPRIPADFAVAPKAPAPEAKSPETKPSEAKSPETKPSEAKPPEVGAAASSDVGRDRAPASRKSGEVVDPWRD